MEEPVVHNKMGSSAETMDINYWLLTKIEKIKNREIRKYI